MESLPKVQKDSIRNRNWLFAIDSNAIEIVSKKRNIFGAINVRAQNTWPQNTKLFFGDHSLVKRKSPATSDTKRKNGDKKRCCRPNCLFFTYLLLFYFFSLLLLYFSTKSVRWIFLCLFLMYAHFLFKKNEFCNSTGGRWFIQILSSYFLVQSYYKLAAAWSMSVYCIPRPSDIVQNNSRKWTHEICTWCEQIEWKHILFSKNLERNTSILNKYHFYRHFESFKQIDPSIANWAFVVKRRKLYWLFVSYAYSWWIFQFLWSRFIWSLLLFHVVINYLSLFFSLFLLPIC